MKKREITLKVNKDDEGERLDMFISKADVDISRSAAQKLIEKGLVSLNGAPCLTKKTQVASGDVCTVSYEEVDDELKAEKTELDVVYEDEDIIVVNKTRGMVVHPAPGNPSGTLVNALLYRIGDALRSVGDPKRPGIVHRIDKDTSGLLVAAKTGKAYSGLREQFDVHRIDRAYDALVYNAFSAQSGAVDVPIGRDPANRLRRKVLGLECRRAVTHYTVTEKIGNFTLIEARLETGRTHQIRVHMAYEGHPVAGDTVYGPSPDRFKFGGQILHAKLLGFEHPVTGEHMEFTAERPEYFVKAINKVKRLTK